MVMTARRHDKISEAQAQQMAEHIKAYAQAQGMTFAAMDDDCGMGDGAFSEMARAKRLTTYRTAHQVARYLGLSDEALLGPVEPAPLADLTPSVPDVSNGVQVPAAEAVLAQPADVATLTTVAEGGTPLALTPGMHVKNLTAYGLEPFGTLLQTEFDDLAASHAVIERMCYAATGVKSLEGQEFFSLLIFYHLLANE